MSTRQSKPPKPPWCARCQQGSTSDDSPLLRCKRCQSRHYCNRTCQANDWPIHKGECGPLSRGEDVPERTRAVKRLNLKDIRDRAEARRLNEDDDSDDDPDKSRPDPSAKISYLRICKPHLHQMSILGPFATAGALAKQVRLALEEFEAFDAIYKMDGMTATGSNGVIGFDAPLPDGNVARFEIEHEWNAEVKQALPHCEVYRVVSSLPMHDLCEEYRRRGLRQPMERIQNHGAYLRKNEAEDRLLEVIGEMQEERPGSRIEIFDRPPEQFHFHGGTKGAVLLPKGREDKYHMVQVQYFDMREHSDED